MILVAVVANGQFTEFCGKVVRARISSVIRVIVTVGFGGALQTGQRARGASFGQEGMGFIGTHCMEFGNGLLEVQLALAHAGKTFVQCD